MESVFFSIAQFLSARQERISISIVLLNAKQLRSGDELGLAGISKGNCRIFLADQEYRKDYGNVEPMLIWLNLESKEEVDELYQAWSANEAKLMSVLESKPWGLHEFTAADLDGNLFRVFYDFATPERATNA